jgi:hypothetical protein
MKSVRLQLSIAANRDWPLFQLLLLFVDLKTASCALAIRNVPPSLERNDS